MTDTFSWIHNMISVPIDIKNHSHPTLATKSTSTIDLELLPHLSFRKVINWAMSRS